MKFVEYHKHFIAELYREIFYFQQRQNHGNHHQQQEIKAVVMMKCFVFQGKLIVQKHDTRTDDNLQKVNGYFHDFKTIKKFTLLILFLCESRFCSAHLR